jgi:hypothetical protein
MRLINTIEKENSLLNLREKFEQLMTTWGGSGSLSLDSLKDTHHSQHNTPVESSSSCSDDGWGSRSSWQSDENICQAMCNFHTPTQQMGETQDKFDASLVASMCICRSSEAAENASQDQLNWQVELEVELFCLQMKQIDYEAKQTSLHPAVAHQGVVQIRRLRLSLIALCFGTESKWIVFNLSIKKWVSIRFIWNNGDG